MTTCGELQGWNFANHKPIRIRWSKNIITSLEVTAEPPADEQWIAPGLFDLQINGYAGVDFQQDDVTLDQLLHAVRSLRSAGCARFLLTLITDEWAHLVARLSRLRSLRNRSDELKTAIAGWHIEGPFLSAEPGFSGAHDPTWMRDPAPELLTELRAAAGDDPLLLTIAPERAGAVRAIAAAVSQKMIVSLGHTDAPVRLLQEAVAAGARGFTHLGNGCPRTLDRHDNILWRVLEAPGLMISLIPDRIHVSPPLFRFIHRMLNPEAIYYTSDAMAAAGSPPGRYRLGKFELEVGSDQIVRQPGKELFAGSALRPIDGIFRAAEMLHCSWREVWSRYSTAPARLMGLQNELAVGQRATFCILRLASPHELGEIQVPEDY